MSKSSSPTTSGSKVLSPVHESVPESVTLELQSAGFLILSFLLLCIYYSNNDPSVHILSILSVCTLWLLSAAVPPFLLAHHL